MNIKESLVISVGIFIVLILGVVFLVSGNSTKSDNISKEPLPVSDLPKVASSSESTSSVGGLQSQKEGSMLSTEINYKARIFTNKGVLNIDLYEETPRTIENFIKLSRDNFYDGVRFHRIIQDFMVQTGDPLTKQLDKKDLWGTGGPGYKFNDEPFSGSYVRGTVAMANSGPNTNGSQFFIMTTNTPLPRNYVIFGTLEGEESFATLDQIAATPVGLSRSGENSMPLEDVIIQSIEIVESSF